VKVFLSGRVILFVGYLVAEYPEEVGLFDELLR